MNARTALVAALLVGTAFHGSALARSPIHDALLQDALLHAQQALEEGREGRPEGVKEHAQQALEGARRVAQDDQNAAQAARQLEDAVAAAKAGDAGSGAFHALLAQAYLQAAAEQTSG